MTATKTKGGWILNGTKKFCTNGHYADIVVVVSRQRPWVWLT